MYRGAFLHGYRNAPVKVAAVMSGIFFGFMHMNAQQFLYAVFLGIVMALIVRYSRSILLAILFHFGFNGLQWTISYGIMQLDIDESAQSANIEALPEETQEFMYRFELFVEQNPEIIAIVMFGIGAAFTLPLLMLAVKGLKDHYSKRFADVDADVDVEVDLDIDVEPQEQDEPYIKGSIVKDPFVWASAGVWVLFVALLTIGEALL